MTTELNRRDFLKTSAVTSVGMTLWFTFGGGLGRAAGAVAYAPDASMTITPDGLVTVHILKSEMGQGVGTALAQIVAEELEADWKDIRIDYPTSDPKLGLMLTGGSWSVNWTFDKLSRAGAAARLALIDAAAGRWQVPPEECIAVRGVVRHLPTGRSMTYGEIVARVPITKTFSEDDLKRFTLKKPSEYDVVGHWIRRLDIPEKTNGRAKFGIDSFVEHMAYAKTAYPPTREGGKHVSVDDREARKVKGWLKTIVTDQLVAVLGTSYEAAAKARDALKITWAPSPTDNVSTESIFRDFTARARDGSGAIEWRKVGAGVDGLAQAARTLQATYTTDYVAHMQMEPMNCVARHDNGVYDLYTGSQFQTLAMGLLAAVLKTDQKNIRIHQHYLGGGFGRRLDPDIILEAAIIAKEAGRPIKLIRSREEDMHRDFLRSATVQTLRGGLDAAGKVTAWDNVLVATHPGTRWGKDFVDKQGLDQFALNGADHVYSIANQSVRAIRVETGISVGYVRAVAPNYTFFAVESFVDELAHLTKADPLAFRLAMLDGAPRLAHVLRLVAQRAGWGTPLPSNVGRGLACVSAQEKKSPTWTASVVQARVDPATGRVRVEKIICAVDCGIVVNPDGVRAQVEGSLLFGLSNATKERATIAHGAIAQNNFYDYQVLRMNEVPDLVEVHVVPSTEYPTGVGEPGVTTIAPALANAIFAATGARVRSVPILPDRVLAALKEKA